MAAAIFILVLCKYFCSSDGKNIFIQQSMSWTDAQKYCRSYYTDLSFATSQVMQENILSAAGTNNPEGWIGLHQDPNNSSQWRWSGGGPMTYKDWDSHQPDNFMNRETKVDIISTRHWNDEYENKSLPFYCVELPVVKIKMSWEKALEHCRQNNSDLASFSSETEFLLAMKEIPQDKNERIWVNLRYLGDHWLWADGDYKRSQMWYRGESVSSEGQCPVKDRCGVLNSVGLLESWDCQDKLYFMCEWGK